MVTTATPGDALGAEPRVGELGAGQVLDDGQEAGEVEQRVVRDAVAERARSPGPAWPGPSRSLNSKQIYRSICGLLNDDDARPGRLGLFSDHARSGWPGGTSAWPSRLQWLPLPQAGWLAGTLVAAGRLDPPAAAPCAVNKDLGVLAFDMVLYYTVGRNLRQKDYIRCTSSRTAFAAYASGH